MINKTAATSPNRIVYASPPVGWLWVPFYYVMATHSHSSFHPQFASSGLCYAMPYYQLQTSVTVGTLCEMAAKIEKKYIDKKNNN